MELVDSAGRLVGGRELPPQLQSALSLTD